jgi:hypothetical protein
MNNNLTCYSNFDPSSKMACFPAAFLIFALNKAQPSSKYKTRNENTQAIFERGSNNAFRSNGQKISVFCPLLSTCTPPKRVRVWSTEILLLNKNRQNFTRPIYMQLWIFHLLTVRRQENKVFSAAFAAENTSFPAGGLKLLQQLINQI